MTLDIRKLRAAATLEAKELAKAHASLATTMRRGEQLRTRGATSAKVAGAVAGIGAAAQQITKVRARDHVSAHLTPATPDEVLGALESNVPIVLLPVRLETRVLRQSAGGWSLCVRVYPDAIHVDAHEPELTQSELEAGLAFWGRSSGDRDGAWLGLVQFLGAQRAAWVAEATRTDPKTGKRVWQGQVAPGRFTRPAWVEAMPDQFFFCVRADGADLPVVEGLRIRPPVATGPDPRLAADADDGTDAGMRWMTDFDTAVAQGLGARIPLGAAPPAVIQQVTVFGVRASLAPADGAALLGRLMQAHHYADGLEVLRVGTPSNSSSIGASGFSAGRLAQAETTPAEAGRTIGIAGDGARLAGALGIDVGNFAGVLGADATSDADAQTMLTALWPGTLGYFLKQMLGESITDEEASLLRVHAISWVRGRGPFAPLRVGRNPYGVLPVTSLSRYVPDGSPDLHADKFLALLRSLTSAWTDAVGRVPKVGRGDPKDSSKVLAEILALSPVSVGIDARRVFPAGMVDILTSLSGMSTDEQETVRAVGRQLVQGALASLGTLRGGDGLGKIVGAGAPRRITIPRIQSAPLSAVQPLVDNYLVWLRAATPLQMASAEERFGTPLLYLLARYSLLHQYARAAAATPNLPLGVDRSDLIDHDIVVDYPGVMKPATGPLQILGLPTSPTAPGTVTVLPLGQRIQNAATGLAVHIKMSGSFARPLSRIDAASPGLPGPGVPDRRTVTFAALSADAGDGTAEAAQVLAALDYLALLPTETLDRLLRETLDLASHRLDAWVTSLATMRLSRMRAVTPTGAHLGAYGFVENIVPAPKANLVQPPGSPTGTEKAMETLNQGFLLAPSLGHAATAAVLRSGQAAHGDGAAFAVTLESARVRRALHVLDGVRQGQSLGALLGYQLERALLDRDAGSAIAKLRDAAPLRTSAIQPPSGVTFEQVAPRDVADGLRIARGEFTDPAFTTSEGTAAAEAIAEVRDTLDATGDLLLAEGVHQIVAGTPARAAAVTQAAAGMGPPPERFDVIASPRSGTGLTQRVLLVSDATSTAWVSLTLRTPRVLADPLLEGWAAARLGDPARYSAVVTFRRVTGETLQQQIEVAVKDLGLGALDVVAMSRPATHGQLCELERRVLDWALDPTHRPAGIPSDVRAAIAGRAEHAAVSVKIPLADLVVAGAAIADLLRVVRIPSPHELNPLLPIDADGFNVGELSMRLSAIMDAGEQLRVRLTDLLINVRDSDVDLAQLVSKLRSASLMIAGALPEVADPALKGARAVLVAQGRGVLTELTRRLAAAQALAAARSMGAGTAEAVDERRQIADLLIDNAPPMAPHLDAGLASSLGNLVAAPPSLGASVTSRAQRASVIRTFLARARHVRRGVKRLDEADALAVALGSMPVSLRVAQAGTPPQAMWVALPNASVPGGVTSIVLAGDAAFTATEPVSVLSVDDWVEVVPRTNEVTALAVHADRPANDAPQSVLVAVPPEAGEPWSVAALRSVLDETFALSAMRMVDLPALAQFGQLLPALMLACTGQQGQIKVRENSFFPRVT